MITNQLHIHRARIDFDLLDGGGVVHHPNYLVLCERARSAALREAGYSFKQMWDDGMALAVIEANSRYSRPLQLDHEIAVVTRTTGSTPVRLSVRQEIVLASALPPACQTSGFKEGPLELARTDVYFAVELVLSCVSLNPFKGTRHPERLLRALRLE